MEQCDWNEPTPLGKFIAYLAELANGGTAVLGDMTTKAFQNGTGMPEEVDLTDGRVQTFQAAAAVMRMDSADINISAMNENWQFHLRDADVDLIGTAGDWTLPFLVMYTRRGLASWQLAQFIAALTKIENNKLRDFVMMAPVKNKLPLTDLISMLTERDDMLIGSHTGFRTSEFMQLEMRPVCEMAMSQTFEAFWQPGSSTLLLRSERIQHGLILATISLPILVSLVWRELHAPE